jgi:Amt family ammonium transporter
MAWSAWEWAERGKPSALGVISGLVAGLVAITPASGFVSIPAALIIGALAGSVCYLSVTKLKIRLGYDDSLDAFGVHGVGGILGALLTGIFANATVNPLINDVYKVNDKVVNLSGGPAQLANQAIAAGITVVASFAGTLLILKVVDAFIGLRVSEEAELQGLDVSLHGEEAYTEHEGHVPSSHVHAAAAPKAEPLPTLAKV